jgi:hypothetical protein
MRTWIDIQVHGTEGGFDGHGSQLLMQGECSKLSIVWRAARVDVPWWAAVLLQAVAQFVARNRRDLAAAGEIANCEPW